MTAFPFAVRGHARPALVLALVLVASGTLSSIGTAAAASTAPSALPSTGLTPASPIHPGPTTLFPGQSSIITANVPSSGTAPYSWQWLYSTNGGQSYEAATSDQCGTPSGQGASAGSEEACTFVASAATFPGTYYFELQVTDSATVPETDASSAHSVVTVERAAASSGASSGAAPRFDTDPQEDCTGGCDTTNWFAGTGGSGALVITTAEADELLLLEVTDSGQTGAGLSTADISDTQGSTWELEPARDWNGFGHDQYIFYAIDATAGSDTVTLDSAAGTHTGATTATAVLSAFEGVDAAAPIAAEGTFEDGTGTQSTASVTTAVSPTTIVGVVSTTNGATGFTATTSPPFTEAGTINDGAATASYMEYYAATATGTYTSEPTWTGAVHWGAVAIAIQGASPLSVTVAPTTEVMDLGQTATITASATGGTGTPSYTWSVDSGSCPGFAGSSTATLEYTPSATTTNCVLTVTVQDTDGDSAQPTTPTTVTVNTQLAIPATPTPSAVALDVNQAETVTGTIPTTGTPRYAWTWLVSVNGGTFAAETHCAINSGGFAAAGATETCAIAANVLTVGDTYNFELQVTDSATTPVTVTSDRSATVTVSSALTVPTAPTVSAATLDVNQALTVSGTIPTTGTPTYSWQWLVSINGGAYAATTQCLSNGGGGATAGAGETCSLAANTLTAGDTYAFELRVTDGATMAETVTSPVSSTVAVSSSLTAPVAPAVSAAALDANQALSVSGTIPSTGTSTYSWQWLVSVDGGAYSPATQCLTNSGTGAAADADETCSIAASTLTAGDSYAFELEVTDSATTPESQTSTSSSTVTVSSELTAPAAPTVSATALDANQALTVTGTMPSTGTSTYSWQWLDSVNGGAYSDATICGASSSGTGAGADTVETCSLPADTLVAGDTYTLELEVSDSATTPETVFSSASSSVAVNSALTAPAAPTVRASALDVDQPETVTGTIPSTGTASYSWQWMVSIDGAAAVAATMCAQNSGSGAAAGAGETCLIAGGTLTTGATYSFELRVTDGSDAGSETQLSSPSVTVSVASSLAAPAAPTVSNATLPLAEPLTVSSTLPSSGTPGYAWQWLISVNGGAYASATVCGSSASGSGGAAGSVVRCTVPSGSLAPDSSYTFELKVTDSATVAENATSAASAAVTVAEPSIGVGTSQGPVGAVYSVAGSGFSASSTVTVSFGSVLLTPTACSDGSFSGTEVTTDSSGRFDCTFAVPSEGAGTYPIVGTDHASSSTTPAYSFLVTVPAITVTPAQGRSGDTVTVNGTGFSVSSPLTSLVFDSLAVTSCTAGSLTTNHDGAFSCTFAVPNGISGSTVRATDVGGASATATYTIVTASTTSSSFGEGISILVGVVALLAVLLIVVGVRRRRASRRDVVSTAPPPGPTPSFGAPPAIPVAAVEPVALLPAPTSMWESPAPEKATETAVPPETGIAVVAASSSEAAEPSIPEVAPIPTEEVSAPLPAPESVPEPIITATARSDEGFGGTKPTSEAETRVVEPETCAVAPAAAAILAPREPSPSGPDAEASSPAIEVATTTPEVAPPAAEVALPPAVESPSAPPVPKSELPPSEDELASQASMVPVAPEAMSGPADEVPVIESPSGEANLPERLPPGTVTGGDAGEPEQRVPRPSPESSVPLTAETSPPAIPEATATTQDSPSIPGPTEPPVSPALEAPGAETELGQRPAAVEPEDLRQADATEAPSSATTPEESLGTGPAAEIPAPSLEPIPLPPPEMTAPPSASETMPTELPSPTEAEGVVMAPLPEPETPSASSTLPTLPELPESIPESPQEAIGTPTASMPPSTEPARDDRPEPTVVPVPEPAPKAPGVAPNAGPLAAARMLSLFASRPAPQPVPRVSPLEPAAESTGGTAPPGPSPEPGRTEEPEANPDRSTTSEFPAPPFIPPEPLGPTTKVVPSEPEPAAVPSEAPRVVELPPPLPEPNLTPPASSDESPVPFGTILWDVQEVREPGVGNPPKRTKSEPQDDIPDPPEGNST